MEELFSRTSVTLDEAVGILIGWIRGPFDVDLFIDDEKTETITSTFDLAEILQDEEELLESRYCEACDDKLSAEVIAQKREAIKSHGLRCEEAKKYLCEIKDELNKGESSALRLDKEFENYTEKRITLSSLNEWTIEEYQIDILSPNRLSVSVQKAQADERALLASGEKNKNHVQPTKPQKQRDLGKAILGAIESLGLNPQSFPKNSPGKPGAKATVRESLAGNNSLFPRAVMFDKAWERLRKDKKITDKP